MTRATATDATQTPPDALNATLRGGDGSSPTETDPDMLNALEKLEGFSPEAEAQACLAAARRFANMKRIVFDTRIAECAAEAETDGEKQALADLGRRGPRALARQFLELAKALGPGGALRTALAEMIRDLKKQLK